jgi:acyl carrier protein
MRWDMPVVTDEVAAEIYRIIREVLGITEADTASGTPFKELGVDSLKIVELMAYLQVEYDIDIPTPDFDRMQDTAGVMLVMSERLNGAAPQPE